MRYTDRQLRNGSQKLYLASAGFVIEFCFLPTEQVFYKRKLIETFVEIWGRQGFLLKKGEGADFTIDFIPEGVKGQVLVRELDQKFFFLIVKKNFQKRKFSVYYSVSPRLLDVLLREIFAFLLRKDGFLLHCSSVLDKNGILSGFLAHSGGGKTTAASLLSEGKVLFSDDVVVARRDKGGWSYFSPPFVEKGKVPVNLRTQKAKLYFVKKGKVASKTKLNDKSKILPLVLEQIWQEKEGGNNFNLAVILKFVQDNEFCWLETTLEKDEMRRVLDED